VRDRDVVDVDLLLADQREQEVERPREGGQLDDEARLGTAAAVSIGRKRVRERGVRGYISHCASDGSENGSAHRKRNPPNASAGSIQMDRIRLPNPSSRMRMTIPYRPSCW